MPPKIKKKDERNKQTKVNYQAEVTENPHHKKLEIQEI
jgi:hypothetical protein